MKSLAIAALCTGLALPAAARADEFRESVRVRAGGTLQVELPSGALEIETHDEETVDVEATARGGWPGGIEFELSGDGTNAKLVASRRGWILGWRDVRARIRVPEEFSLDLETGGGGIEIEAVRGSVNARTSGGSIELEGAQGRVELGTSGGSIRVSDVQGDTSLRTSGGGVRATDLRGDVEARTSGGPIRIHDVDGRVDARTSGGGISVRFEGAPAGELRTSGGSIEVEFEEGKGAELDARTSGGRISISPRESFTGELESGSARGRLGRGGESLALYTSGGNIRVHER